VLHDLPRVGRDHRQLRAEVCRALPDLDQAAGWRDNVFGGSDVKFERFLAGHKRSCEWTDDDGIMCQATALYISRNIYIVGTKNSGPGDRGYTRLDGGPEADFYPPLFIGYYQDQHFQSLERPAGLPSTLAFSAGPGLHTVAALGREMGLRHLPPTVVSGSMAWRAASHCAEPAVNSLWTEEPGSGQGSPRPEEWPEQGPEGSDTTYQAVIIETQTPLTPHQVCCASIKCMD
jgi:hypothetical protein